MRYVHKKIYIVAEIGCNHNGNKELAKKMILEAKQCGIDAVKFQAFIAKEMISQYAPKAEYQKRNTGMEDSQLEMTEKLELSQGDLVELEEYADMLGLDSFSTPFDMESVKFLESVGQKIWKIPSGEITNLPYLQEIGRFKIEGKKIILSSGMSTVPEIETCMEVLLNEGVTRDQITLLHCTTEYPTADQYVNLRAIHALQQKFPEISIGLSDHSVGYVAAIGAAAMGVSLIEKHFTLDKNMPGPDHRASANPEELKALVENVRRIEVMAGCGEKIVMEPECKNRIVARKSIVAARNIKKGELLTRENITCKRPGNGISPMEWYHVLGKHAEKDFARDELIVLDGFAWQEENFDLHTI